MKTIVAVLLTMCTQGGECDTFELEIEAPSQDTVEAVCDTYYNSQAKSAVSRKITIKSFACFEKN